MKLKTKKLLAILLAAVMLIAVLAGCASGEEDTNQTTKTEKVNTTEGKGSEFTDVAGEESDYEVTVGIMQDPESLFPYLTGQTARQVTHPMIYQSLYRKDANNVMQPCMAYTYDKVADHTYDVKMYDYIHDWNGNSITSSDVLFSWKIYEESGRAGGTLKYIESITAPDDYTVRFTLKDNEASNTFDGILATNIFSEKSYKDGGEADGFASKPVGSGRYKPVEWVEGSYIVFERWDDYWQTDKSVVNADCDLAYPAKVTLTVITETSQMAIALETGKIDATVDIDVADWVNFVGDDGTPKSGFNAIGFSENLIPVIWMNNSENSILHDERIRKAICYAIDMDAICTALFGVNAYSVGTWARQEAAFFDPAWGDEAYYAYDVDKAKELLADAGYPDGGFTLNTCGCPADYADDIFLYVQAYLDELNIGVTINNYDSALFLTYRDDTTATAWDMTVSRSTCPTVPKFLSFLDVNSYKTGMNAFYFNDPTLQDLYDKANNATTYSEETVRALVEYCYDHCFGYPCWVQSSYCFTLDKVAGVKLSEPKKVIPGSIVLK